MFDAPLHPITEGTLGFTTISIASYPVARIKRASSRSLAGLTPKLENNTAGQCALLHPPKPSHIIMINLTIPKLVIAIADLGATSVWALPNPLQDTLAARGHHSGNVVSGRDGQGSL